MTSAEVAIICLDASNRPENWIPDSKTKPNVSKMCEVHSCPPRKKKKTKKKNESQVQKTPWCRCINQSAAHGFFCCSPCLTKAAMKRIQNHHQRFQRFQVSGIIHQLPVSFMMGGEYTQKSVMHGYKKNGNPFQLNSFKGFLVCPERNSECLIFSRCWRWKPLYIGPIVSLLTAYITVKTLKYWEYSAGSQPT